MSDGVWTNEAMELRKVEIAQLEVELAKEKLEHAKTLAALNMYRKDWQDHCASLRDMWGSYASVVGWNNIGTTAGVKAHGRKETEKLVKLVKSSFIEAWTAGAEAWGASNVWSLPNTQHLLDKEWESSETHAKLGETFK